MAGSRASPRRGPLPISLCALERDPGRRRGGALSLWCCSQVACFISLLPFPLILSSFLVLFLACSFSFALFCFLLGFSKGQAAAARSPVSFPVAYVPLSQGGGSGGASGSRGFLGFGFSRGVCDYGALFPYPFACGGDRRGAVPCPGRAAPSPSSSARMSSCAERSLRKMRPEPDLWLSPGALVSVLLPPGGGLAPLSVCRAGTQAFRGADTASSCAYACAYTSASPVLHAGIPGI